MKYYLVAGEASGDLHGSNLMKALKQRDAHAEFRFVGGDLMAAEGGTQLSHYRDRAFMGLWEVITHLRTIAGYLKQTEKDILDYKPDALILIDNPGFNLRLAEFAKKKGIAVHYYIAPKVWAWNTSRVKKIRAFVDHLYCILPFEPEFFAKHGVQATYVGNPVVDAVTRFRPDPDWTRNSGITRPVIALLPGSRRNEIERILPVFLQAIPKFPEYQFVIAAAPDFDTEWYNKFGLPENLQIAKGQTYQILSESKAALVASGTATLETALFQVPQVVCYRVASLTYVLGKMLVKLKWFGLVNLILNRGLLTELLQGEFTPERTASELRDILTGQGRDHILQGYADLRRVLGGEGASEKTAELICGKEVK